MALQRRQVLQVDVEASYGGGGSSFTDEEAFVETMPDMSGDPIENPVYKTSLARNKMAIGKRRYSFDTKYYLKGSGTAGTAPAIGKLLKLAGLGETIVAVTSVTYSPVDTSHPSGALKLNEDGLQYLAVGARADTTTLTWAAGQPVEVEQKIMGFFALPTAMALPTPSYPDVLQNPPTSTGMVLTIASNTHIISKAVIELKNQLEEIESLNASNFGIQEFRIVERQFGATFTVERDSNNQTLWPTNWSGTTEMAVTSTGIGSAGNLLGFSMTNLQIETIKPTVVKGTMQWEVKCRINPGSTLANEFSLFFK